MLHLKHSLDFFGLCLWIGFCLEKLEEEDVNFFTKSQQLEGYVLRKNRGDEERDDEEGRERHGT